MNKRYTALGALSITAMLALSACGNATIAADGSSKSKGVSLVGFSVLQQPNAAVIDGFLKTSAGQGLSTSDFKQSYGASGDQRDLVLQGAPTDEAHLSLEPDITKLVSAGLVSDDWNQGPDKGICTQSIVVFVVKKGNPLGIHSWSDLVDKDVKIDTPDPSSSGSAKWNLLAAYGSAFASGSGTQADGEAYLKKFYANVATQPSSGRDATTAFETGKYDVLLSYENEAIAARASGQDFDYVIPTDSTLLIQNPCALTKTASATAKSFLAYQQSKAGQTIYAENGFRPLSDAGVGTVTVKGAEDSSDPYPTPAKLETIDDSEFGGWGKANDFFFGDGVDGDTLGLVTKIQKEAS